MVDGFFITYNNGHLDPGLGQAHRCGRVKTVSGIPPSPS